MRRRDSTPHVSVRGNHNPLHTTSSQDWRPSFADILGRHHRLYDPKNILTKYKFSMLGFHIPSIGPEECDYVRSGPWTSRIKWSEEDNE